MKVITFQSKEVLKYLEKNGYLRCEDKYIDKDKMSPTYNWVIQNMNERVKNKSNATYPIWCWVKCNRSICPPKHKGKPIEGFDVKITFNVKDEEIFITDFRRYSFLLSNTYIPENKTEKDEFDKVHVYANIIVERPTQKGIIIGKGGKLLKEIGVRARKDIEQLLGNKVYLELWVKVEKDWRKKKSHLQDFGYRTTDYKD